MRFPGGTAAEIPMEPAAVEEREEVLVAAAKTIAGAGLMVEPMLV
jgi:hypothetical protein